MFLKVGDFLEKLIGKNSVMVSVNTKIITVTRRDHFEKSEDSNIHKGA
jgi:hypothetical protein